jgi:hypothetical protein
MAFGIGQGIDLRVESSGENMQKADIRTQWEGAAPGWARWEATVATWMEPATEAMLTMAGVVVGVFRRSRRFLPLSVFPAALLVAFSAPMVIWNVFAFLTGHLLYLDSPGTIFVVLVIAIMVTLPSTVVLAIYWARRREVFGR